MLNLYNVQRVVEEGPDCIKQCLKKYDVPYEEEQTVIPKWTSTNLLAVHAVCGSVSLTCSRLEFIVERLGEEVYKQYNTYNDQCFYVNFDRKSVEPEEYYIELSIFLTDNFWRRMLNEYSLCDLATGLGPKLYPALLEIMEGCLCYVEPTGHAQDSR